MTMSNTKPTIHERVTETIINAIEQGASKFQMPWHQQAIGLRNIASGKAYRGVNVLTLWAVSMNRGYTGGAWGTFKQWREREQFVRKGEKGRANRLLQGHRNHRQANRRRQNADFRARIDRFSFKPDQRL